MTKKDFKKRFSLGKLCLAIVLLLILSPVIIGLICAIVACLLGLGIFAGALIIGVVLICVVALYCGIGVLLSAPLVGSFYIGISFLSLGLMLMGVPVLIWLSKWIAKICKGTFNFLVQKTKKALNKGGKYDEEKF